jgi:Asp-tRNA(Asn)/Glu-tRNA(Gln) amidotransferase A subunit family amidase
MPDTFSLADIVAAERLMGVEYTPEEREMMGAPLEAQLRHAITRRGIALPHDLGPATRFDPRLPGFVMPSASGVVLPPDATRFPDSDADIAFAPVTAQSAWIRSGALSCARLTAIYLERIARLAPLLACFTLVDAEGATARAAELDRLLAAGTWLGPLHGIPYAAKDILDTAGLETAWGAEPYRGRIPETDATVVRRLHAAGAVLLAKTSVGALAYGDIWYGGRTNNPWNLNEGSSGSSAGSGSATAAGLVGFALGTETLGSIVSPSTRCGVTGLRPTFGRVPRTGAMALCWTLDKIGPMCRAVDDTALVLNVLNGADPSDVCQIPAPFGYDAIRPVAGMRVGYYPADFAEADALDRAALEVLNGADPGDPFGIEAPFAADVTADVTGLRLGYFPQDFDDPAAHAMDRAALEQARGLGVTLVELERPPLPYEVLGNLLCAEAAASFEELTLTDRDDLLTWQEADAWPNQFRRARFLSAVDHVQLDRFRRRVMQVMDAAFAGVNAVIGPSLSGPMLSITNFTGHPCLCLPVGLREAPVRGNPSLSRSRVDLGDSTGSTLFQVPHSISLWGGLFAEGPMLAVGQALERAWGFAGRRPGL